MKTKAGDKRPARRERELVGLGVAPGIAIGPAAVSESGAVQVPEYTVAKGAIEDEIKRFNEAAERARRQVQKLRRKVDAQGGTVAEEMGYLLDAHLQMLSGSRLMRGVEQRIAHGSNAEAAVQHEISALAQSFADLDDTYFAARAQDVREVGTRLIRHLTKTPYQAFSMLPEGSVVLAEEISPADAALMDPRRIAGFATVLGGAESHTAIMARSLGLPAVLGLAGLLEDIKTGTTVIVDGDAGRVIVEPSRQTLARYRKRLAAIQHEKTKLAGLASLPAVTRDGTRVTLMANVDLPREIEPARAAGAEGVGLLRTEFLFMNRKDVPGEDEQAAMLTEMVGGMDGRTVTVRTLDVGGDKLTDALGDRATAGANPALGLRAIRLSLRQPALLETQLAAMLRASARGPVRILLPMISSVTQVQAVRHILGQVARRLVRRGVEIADPLPPLGIMIEVPGAALAADALARVSDFFALGTNDLTQYTLAIDRGDEQVADLYNPLHPAVLRLVQFSVEAAARARIPVSVCGEIAGDPRFTALLLGLGVRELSMGPANLPRVKRRVRHLDTKSAAKRAREIMQQSDDNRIAALLDEFNQASV
ncbi:MAG: phosphoenolpyruvate--protein phosphotransferase [Alphaproteobacteria bacterium]|nr:phosphoenolpyruvate--protein phosphotransferase [Alphaproteobacteria bacterium]